MKKVSDDMKKKTNWIGVLILIVIFLLFYFITTFFLNKRNISKNTINEDNVVKENIDYVDEENIVSNLYNEVKILYDVVNNRYTVSQDDTIVIGDIIYKKITNFDDVVGNLFTKHGVEKYINDLGNYFAVSDEDYYLAGNLVSYQTYYFRGDNTNIYIMDSNNDYINAIIYEKWSSMNKNTLATMKVVNIEGNWLIDNIDILANE